MNLYEDQFSEKHNFPEQDAPSKTIIISSTGRCGSHMLGHVLYQTGQFGFPLEYANNLNLNEWKKRLGVDDFKHVMHQLQRIRTSPNGVFGIKIHYPHIRQFGGIDGLMNFFPNAYYILLSRKNVLAQAVSLSIAKQTGVWISGLTPINDKPKYDFKHINECLRETIINNAKWRYILAANGCNYIEMDFDHIRNNLEKSVTHIANFVGIKLTSDSVAKERITKKQSNELNEEWVSRFILDSDNIGELL